MSADPRTLAADLAAERQSRYEWQRKAIESEAAMFNMRREYRSLHDAWLTARPPCPTCGGKGPNRRDSTYHDEVFPSPCPGCPDGIQPFDKWTAGLVERLKSYEDDILRLAEFIIHEVPGEPSRSEGAIDCTIRLLRQIGDTR